MAEEEPGERGPSGRRERYHHGDLRQALLTAAAQHLRAGGPEAVKMNLLAQELGVSVAAPYRHFPTREALLVALAEDGATRMARALDEAAAHQGDPLQAQRARGVAYVRFCVAEPALFRLLSRRDLISASPLLQQLDARQRAALEPALGAHHPGLYSPELARRSAGLLAAQALTYGLVHLVVDGLLGEVDPDQAARLAQEVTGVLGTGLAGGYPPEAFDAGSSSPNGPLPTEPTDPSA